MSEKMACALTPTTRRGAVKLQSAFTVSTALDTLCHATESYLSNKATDKSSAYSEKAIALVYNELVSLLETRNNPDEKHRDILYDASIYAGLAIEKTGCCFPHTVGYFLTEKHSVPHGKACAVFLPEYVRRGLEFNCEKTKRFLETAGTDFESFKNVKISLDKNELEEYLPNWEKAANFDNSPGGFTSQKAFELIKELFE